MSAIEHVAVIYFILFALSFVVGFLTRKIRMFNVLANQIARLSELLSNLSTAMSVLTSERDVLKARVAELEASIASLPEMEAALQAQIDIAAAMIPVTEPVA